MSNLAKVTTTGTPLPAVQTPEQRRKIAAMTSGATMEGGRMVLLPGKSLSAEDRRDMAARLSTLRSCLDQRDRRATEAIIAAFLAGYGSSRGNDAEARLVVGSFASVLAEIPPWAVAEAARAWGRGGYGAVASAFAPSAAQFHECAVRIIDGYAREARDLERLLAAEEQPVSEEERERVAAGFDDLLSGMRGRQPSPASATALARSRFDEMCRAAGVDPDSIKDQPVSMKPLRSSHPNG